MKIDVATAHHESVNIPKRNGMMPTRDRWIQASNTEPYAKNAWDLRCLRKVQKTECLDVHLDCNVNWGIRKNTVYGSITLLDGEKKRVAFADGELYVLPDPPFASWNPFDFHFSPVTRQRISRNLWDISFYMLKPFIDQEVCNCVKDIALSEIPWGDLYTEYAVLNCMVLRYYTGIHADDVRNPEGISVYASLQDSLDPIVTFIHQEAKGDFSFLNEYHWAAILTLFCDSFMSLYEHHL
jgi:hypothetical protein